jgi:hypothetical protein
MFQTRCPEDRTDSTSSLGITSTWKEELAVTVINQLQGGTDDDRKKLEARFEGVE